MNIDRDIERLQLQEKRLQFKKFDAATAWQIGSALKAAAEKRNAAVAIDISLHGHQLFAFSMPGTTPDNLEWIRRKRNTVQRYLRSSYAIGLKHEKNKTTLAEAAGLHISDYASHGGCFPIILEGTGCVGTITVSGLPQRDDHEIVVAALQEFLGLTGEDLALDKT